MKRVFAHIGFSFAITLIVLNVFGIKAAFAVLAVTGAAFALSVFFKKTRRAVAVPICMLSAFLACVLFIGVYAGVFLPQKALDGKTVSASFYITDIKESEIGDYFTYTIKTVSADDENAPQKMTLKLTSGRKIEADCYQVIKGSLRLSLVAENGFDSYGNFGNGIFLTARPVSVSVQNAYVSTPEKLIYEIRSGIRDFIENNEPKREASVLEALLIGDKSRLSEEIKTDFSLSGASHLLAVSGLHLTVLSGALFFFLKMLKTPKIPRVAVSVLSVLFYMALTGFSKSVTRAGIMMIILLAGELINEKSDALNSLGIAVLVICLNPFAVTDAGALLTVCAVLGLVTIEPMLAEKIKPKNDILRFFSNIFTASVSVFITTLPVLFLFFGYVSIIGTALNLIMIPVAQITLVSTLLAVVFQWLSPICAVFLFLARSGAGAMLSITKECARLPYAVTSIGTAEIGLAIAAVLLLFGTAIIIGRKRLIKICAPISAAVFIAVFCVSAFINSNSVFIREISGYYTTAAAVYDSNSLLVIGVEDYSQYSAVKSLAKSKGLDIAMIIDTNNSDYSKRLTQEFDVLNYITQNPDELAGIKCENIVAADEFDIDLWQSVNVKYHCEKGSAEILLTIYGQSFGCADESDISLDYTDGYDELLTVNRYGFSKRGLNQWLK